MQSTEQEDYDPCSILMEVAMYDEGNLIYGLVMQL